MPCYRPAGYGAFPSGSYVTGVLSPGGLLEHSVEVAMTARMLCRQYRLDGRTADVAFLGGLLHDVGKLYLYYNVEAGEGICSQHEALNFMKLEPHLQSLMSQDPRAFEALSACLSASIGKPLIQYMPETIVKMADRLSAEVFNWRRVFAGLPDFYWFRKSTSDTRIYKRLD
jgi:3'-5' exoribonuclease